MAYPERGAWVFYNVRRASSFWPTLDSISITQEFPDVVASMSCRVVDEAGTLEFDVEDEVRVTFAGDRIFAGHLKVVTEDRLNEFGPRVWDIEAQDYTAKLGDAIIRQRAHRKKESALRRVRWILSYLDNAWRLDGRELDVPDEDVERQDMYGMTVAEALDSVANEVGLRYWVDLDNVLHVEKATTTSAPFDLSNVAPNLTTTFPFREFSYRRDTTELANAVLVEPEKRDDSKWAVAQANIDLYEWGRSTGRQELFVAAEEIRTARAAERHADAQVQRTKQAEGEVTLVCFQPGIWAGMTVNVEEALWDIDAPFKVVRVDISAVDPHDETGKAYMRCELTLNTKRKRRKPKMGRPEGETADTTPKVVDRFGRTVQPKATEPGDALGVGWTAYHVEYGMNGLYAPGVEILDIGIGGTSVLVESGFSNQPWTHPGVYCGIGFGAWSGWHALEAWFQLTVPAVPAGMAGIRFDVTPDTPYGAATVILVRTLSGIPTAGGQGGLAGTIPVTGTTSVLIPAAQIPAEGGELWVGFAYGWGVDLSPWTGLDSYVCVTVPRAGRWSGERGGGMVWAGPSAASWEVLTSGDTDWGTTESDSTWQDAGVEGSPVAGMDGESFYVEGAGGQGLYLEGERDAEDEPAGSWSDVSWATEITFTASSLATGGSITLTTTGQGQQTIGTIDLDATPGISVAAPATVESAAVAIGTGEQWVAKFDSRSGSMRGKVWPANTQEPAEWNVEVPMSETEDDADRFEMWVRAGAGQTIRVLGIKSYAAARAGEAVVTEWLGAASGDTNRFVTNHRYRDGTLIPWVLGVADPAIRESGATTQFDLDMVPTATSGIHASYIAAGDDE
jgi:hypothetical protein